jgi:hypothetical protein
MVALFTEATLGGRSASFDIFRDLFETCSSELLAFPRRVDICTNSSLLYSFLIDLSNVPLSATTIGTADLI